MWPSIALLVFLLGCGQQRLVSSQYISAAECERQRLDFYACKNEWMNTRNSYNGGVVCNVKKPSDYYCGVGCYYDDTNTAGGDIPASDIDPNCSGICGSYIGQMISCAQRNGNCGYAPPPNGCKCGRLCGDNVVPRVATTTTTPTTAAPKTTATPTTTTTVPPVTTTLPTTITQTLKPSTTTIPTTKPTTTSTVRSTTVAPTSAPVLAACSSATLDDRRPCLFYLNCVESFMNYHGYSKEEAHGLCGWQKPQTCDCGCIGNRTLTGSVSLAASKDNGCDKKCQTYSICINSWMYLENDVDKAKSFCADRQATGCSCGQTCHN